MPCACKKACLFWITLGSTLCVNKHTMLRHAALSTKRASHDDMQAGHAGTVCSYCPMMPQHAEGCLSLDASLAGSDVHAQISCPPIDSSTLALFLARRLAFSNVMFYQVHAVHDAVSAVLDALLDAATGMPAGQQQTCSR